jgi:hypothetical protein
MYAEKSAGIFRDKYISLVLAATGVSLTCDRYTDMGVSINAWSIK